MSVNILNLLKDQVGGQLAGPAAKYLGESESAVSKGLGAIFPALLGTMANNTKDEGMMGKLFDMAKGSNFDDLGDIGGLFGGGASKAMGAMNMGGTLMNLLMGNKTGAIVDIISKFAGLKGGTATSLLKLAAPFLLRTIGKQITGGGLNLAGFKDMLLGQKDHIKAATPSGFDFGSLGFGDGLKGAADSLKGAAGDVKGLAGDAVNVGKNVAGGVANVAGDVGGAAVKTGGGLLKWLFPLFLGLLALGYFGSKGCNTGIDAIDSAAAKTMDVTEGAAKGAGNLVKDGAGAVGDAAGAAGGAVKDMAAASGDMLGAAFGTVSEAGKKALDAVKFTTGSAGDQMMKYIEGGLKGDNKFTFRGLTFATGSAEIAAATAGEVDNMAAILNTYTDVKVSVTGHTDSTGDAGKNEALSQARADAVKARLMAKGIDASRVMTKGYGSAQPVGDNATAEGRKQNRRIEMMVIK